jgi:hypothetical protein
MGRGRFRPSLMGRKEKAVTHLFDRVDDAPKNIEESASRAAKKRA